MKIKELLNHPLLELPKKWRGEYESYYESVIRIGLEYLELIKSLEPDEISGEDEYLKTLSHQNLVKGCTAVYRATIHCIRIYLDEGNAHKAYESFNKHFSFKQELPNSAQPLFYIETTPIYPRLYRLRQMDGKAEIEDLFHVPFELRHKLESNRYSIPGYPTLYFSNSIYTAYKELGEPDYDDLYASKFEHTQHFNRTESVLDLMNYPEFEDPSYVYKYLARWPLIMACNIKVGFPNQPFKSEYVIPQIVLQWVKNNLKIGGRKIIGVTYPSSKFLAFGDQFKGFFYNTAIPVHHSNKVGYCNVLSETFSLTKPISFNEALKTNINATQQGQVKSISLNGAISEYIETDFGKIEEVLSQHPYNKMFLVKANP